MKRQLHPYILAMALAALVGCASPKVLVPPRMELSAYHSVGLIVFTSNAKGTLAEYTTQQFMQRVQAGQPGVRILELGAAEGVLQAVGHTELNFEAMRAIGARWGVDAVFAGHLDITDVKPQINVRSLLTSLDLHADVEAALRTRLVETASGATVWTQGAHGKATVAQIHARSHGPVEFGAQDPEEAYGKLVHQLVNRITHDFWAHWRRA